jgi:hypothetical protein
MANVLKQSQAARSINEFFKAYQALDLDVLPDQYKLLVQDKDIDIPTHDLQTYPNMRYINPITEFTKIEGDMARSLISNIMQR